MKMQVFGFVRRTVGSGFWSQGRRPGQAPVPNTRTKPETGFWIRLLCRLLGRSGQLTESSHPERCKFNCDYKCLIVAPDVHVSVHDDGLAILHISTGRVFLCNRTGARIWQGLESGLSVDAISEKISRDCAVPWQLVRRHTSSFLLEVERHGLVIRKVGHRP